jgi:hypothetical protein
VRDFGLWHLDRAANLNGLLQRGDMVGTAQGAFAEPT